MSGRWKGKLENQILRVNLVLKARNILKSEKKKPTPKPKRKKQTHNPSYCKKEGIYCNRDSRKHRHREDNGSPRGKIQGTLKEFHLDK